MVGWKRKILDRAAADPEFRARLVRIGALADRCTNFSDRVGTMLGQELVRLALEAELLDVEKMTQSEVYHLIDWGWDQLGELAYRAVPPRKVVPGKGNDAALGSVFLSWSVKLPRDRAAMLMLKRSLDFFHVDYFDYTTFLSDMDDEEDDDDERARKIFDALKETTAKADVSIEIVSSEMAGRRWVQEERRLLGARRDLVRLLVCLDGGLATHVSMLPEQEAQAVRIDMSDGRPSAMFVAHADAWLAAGTHDSHYRSFWYAAKCFEVGWRVRRFLERRYPRRSGSGFCWRPFAKLRSQNEFMSTVWETLERSPDHERTLAEEQLARNFARELTHAPSVLSNAGVALRRAGQTTWAVALLTRATEIDDPSPALWTNLGNALRQAGKLGAALEAFVESLERRPNHPLTLTNLGYALWLKGRTAEAIEVLRHALDLRPGHPGTILNLAMALFRQGDRAMATEMLGRLAPEHPQYAFALLVTGEADQARRRIAVSTKTLPPGLVQELRDDLDVLVRADVAGASECMNLVDRVTRKREVRFMPAEAVVRWIERAGTTAEP